MRHTGRDENTSVAMGAVRLASEIEPLRRSIGGRIGAKVVEDDSGGPVGHVPVVGLMQVIVKPDDGTGLAVDDPRGLTLTGGLPYFGGPGNSYSLHAIASMVDRLRAAPEQYGLVLANGGFLSKEAVGIYAAQPPIDWKPVDSSDLGSAIAADPVPAIADGPATIRVETYTVGFAKGAAARGYVIGRTAEGARVLARTRQEDGAMLQTLLDRDPIGATAQIVREGEANVIAALEPAA